VWYAVRKMSQQDTVLLELEEPLQLSFAAIGNTSYLSLLASYGTIKERFTATGNGTIKACCECYVWYSLKGKLEVFCCLADPYIESWVAIELYIVFPFHPVLECLIYPSSTITAQFEHVAWVCTKQRTSIHVHEVFEKMCHR
jgi:hypothetical protein